MLTFYLILDRGEWSDLFLIVWSYLILDCCKHLIGSWLLKRSDWLLIFASILFDSWFWEEIWFVPDCMKVFDFVLIVRSTLLVLLCWKNLIGSCLLLVFCLVFDCAKLSNRFLIVWSTLIGSIVGSNQITFWLLETLFCIKLLALYY